MLPVWCSDAWSLFSLPLVRTASGEGLLLLAAYGFFSVCEIPRYGVLGPSHSVLRASIMR